MNIILTEHFIESLGKIVDFIAKDSEARADKFAEAFKKLKAKKK